jgi:hypothetical protein
MKRIFIPSQSATDWQHLLGMPKLHWKKGFSAMTTAACWEAAGGDFPIEVRDLLNSSSVPCLQNLIPLAIFPEWQEPLDGGDTASQTDVLVVAGNEQSLAVIAVEAKVDEEFGPTLATKRSGASEGQLQRLQYLHNLLGLQRSLDNHLRYQLLHRVASAILSSKSFHAPVAVMLVHSFRKKSRWRGDFDAFRKAIGAVPVTKDIWRYGSIKGLELFLAWCVGNEEFRQVELPSMF